MRHHASTTHSMLFQGQTAYAPQCHPPSAGDPPRLCGPSVRGHHASRHVQRTAPRAPISPHPDIPSPFLTSAAFHPHSPYHSATASPHSPHTPALPIISAAPLSALATLTQEATRSGVRPYLSWRLTWSRSIREASTWPSSAQSTQTAPFPAKNQERISTIDVPVARDSMTRALYQMPSAMLLAAQ